jgi:hypothetical protein
MLTIPEPLALDLTPAQLKLLEHEATAASVEGVIEGLLVCCEVNFARRGKTTVW